YADGKVRAISGCIKNFQQHLPLEVTNRFYYFIVLLTGCGSKDFRCIQLYHSDGAGAFVPDAHDQYHCAFLLFPQHG
ncbi:MAG: hypothetical protein IJ337_02285, partial [Clostridia bacterium]|nr:hypothetical protein [Clostridia bacterium]